MTDESESIVTRRQIFLYFCLSVGWGACTLPLTHAFLQELASELEWDPFGFNTASPYTSIRIGLIGGAFTSPLVLGGAYIGAPDLPLLGCGPDLIFMFIGLPMIAIGGFQGIFGSAVLAYRSVAVDGQESPDALGIGGATIAGCFGGFLAFVIAIILYFLHDRFLRLTLCERCTAGQDSESACNYISPAPDSRSNSCLPSRNNQR